MQSSSSQPARMKVRNFPGLQITGPGKCQQDGSSRDISSYKCRTKHHNLTHKSYSLSKRNSPLRNCYAFNISDLDWTAQWSTWIHFSHQVLPPAASAIFFPQHCCPVASLPRAPEADPRCSEAQEPWIPYWLPTGDPTSRESAPADPQQTLPSHTFHLYHRLTVSQRPCTNAGDALAAGMHSM